MRFFYFLILLLITIVEIGPIPIIGIVLMWVVLFRPRWFYNLVHVNADLKLMHPLKIIE